MRIAITAAFAAASLIALPGVANAGVFSCDADGGKQEGAAIVGAIVGGFVGNKVAKGERGAGTVVGAGLGAAIGSSIGCKMQEEDQRRAQVALEKALETGQPTSWRNPKSGAYGDIRVTQASNSGYWYAPNSVNVRATPSTKGRIVGQMAAGESFGGMSHNTGWLKVDGGYVSKSVVRAAPRQDGCETVEQTVYTKKYGRETEHYRACRKPGGAWDISKI